MTNQEIPADAVVAATKVLYADKMSNHSGDNAPQIIDACEAVVRKILEAAAPHMLANLTAESPRLPTAVRNQLFEMLGDFMDKFELESRVKGPSRHVAAPGYEWGDMCGDFERRVVAALRTTK